MTTAQVALLISGLSLLTAVSALVWNISRDLQRSKLQVRFACHAVFSNDLLDQMPDYQEHELPHMLMLFLTNMGPAPVRVKTVVLGFTLRQRLRKLIDGDKFLHAIVPTALPEFEQALSNIIDVGEEVQIGYPDNADIVLEDEFARIGV